MGEGRWSSVVRLRQCVSACLSSDDDHDCCYYRYLIRTGVAFVSHGNLPVARRKARPRTTVSPPPIPRHPGDLYRPCTCAFERQTNYKWNTSSRPTRPANFRNRPRSWLPRSRSEGCGGNVENHNSHTYIPARRSPTFFFRREPCRLPQ